jgi:hypothetical protein
MPLAPTRFERAVSSSARGVQIKQTGGQRYYNRPKYDAQHPENSDTAQNANKDHETAHLSPSADEPRANNVVDHSYNHAAD